MNRLIINNNPSANSITGNGDGLFFVKPDKPNYTKHDITKRIRVTRGLGADDDKYVDVVQKCRDQGTFDWRSENVFYPTSKINTLEWNSEYNPENTRVYKNAGNSAEQINDNWKLSGVAQKGLGLTENKPFVANMYVENSNDSDTSKYYTKRVWIRSYGWDVMTDNVAESRNWTVTHVRNSGIGVTITLPQTQADNSQITINSNGNAQSEAEDLFKFIQEDTELEFYIRVVTTPIPEQDEPGGGDEPGGDEPTPTPTPKLTSISCDDIDLEAGYSDNLLNYIDWQESEYQFGLSDIQTVGFDDSSLASYNSSTGEITASRDVIGVESTIITIRTKNGKTATATITVTGQEPTPVDNRKSLLITYEYEPYFEDGDSVTSTVLNTATYVYTKYTQNGEDKVDYLTNKRTSSVSGHDDISGSENAVSVEEYYGSGVTSLRSNHSYGPENNATVFTYNGDNIIQFGGNPEYSDNAEDAGGNYYRKQQVLIILGNENNNSLVKYVNSQNKTDDNKIYIDLFASWFGVEDNLDHSGKDDGRPIFGLMKNVTVQLFDDASFIHVDSTNSFERLVSNVNAKVSKKLVNSNGMFNIGASGAANALDPKEYYSSLAQIVFDINNPDGFTITDKRTLSGKAAGKTCEFYPEFDTNSGITLSGGVTAQDITSAWVLAKDRGLYSGTTVTGTPYPTEQPEICSSGYAAANPMMREYLISGFDLSQDKIPLKIHSFTMLPKNMSDDTFPQSFKTGDLTQVANTISRGFTIYSFPTNYSSQAIKVIQSETDLGYIYDSEAAALAGWDIEYYDRSNPGKGYYFIKTYGDFGYGVHVDIPVNETSASFVLDLSEALDYAPGAQQANNIRFYDVFVVQDNTPELMHIAIQCGKPVSSDTTVLAGGRDNVDSINERNNFHNGDCIVTSPAALTTAQLNNGRMSGNLSFTAYEAHPDFTFEPVEYVTCSNLDNEENNTEWFKVWTQFRANTTSTWTTEGEVSENSQIRMTDNLGRAISGTNITCEPIMGNNTWIIRSAMFDAIPYYEVQANRQLYVQVTQPNENPVARYGEVTLETTTGESDTLYVIQAGTVKVKFDISVVEGARNGSSFEHEELFYRQLEWRTPDYGDSSGASDTFSPDGYTTNGTDFVVSATINGQESTIVYPHNRDVYEIRGAEVPSGAFSDSIMLYATITAHIYQYDQNTGTYEEVTDSANFPYVIASDPNGSLSSDATIVQYNEPWPTEKRNNVVVVKYSRSLYDRVINIPLRLWDMNNTVATFDVVLNATHDTVAVVG